MSARLTLDERAELERLRKLTEEQGEELKAWREYGREDEASHFQGWASSMSLARSPALILATLMDVPGEPVSNERLLQAIESERIDPAQEPDSQIIKVHVHRIRHALKQRGFPEAINTHYGFGYSIKIEAARALAVGARPGCDTELIEAARIVVEKHAIGKLQPAHIDGLRAAITREAA